MLTFEGRAVFGSAHWKLDAIDEYAAGRPAAWIDDNLDDECRAWAQQRSEPHAADPDRTPAGMPDDHVEELLAWADAQARSL